MSVHVEEVVSNGYSSSIGSMAASYETLDAVVNGHTNTHVVLHKTQSTHYGTKFISPKTVLQFNYTDITLRIMYICIFIYIWQISDVQYIHVM